MKYNGKNSSKILFDFKEQCTFKHGDKITKLIKARILENNQNGSTIMPDSANYFCVEIPIDMNLQELLQNKIFTTLNEIKIFDDLPNDVYTHIGIIDRINDGKYQIFNATTQSLNYIHDVMNKEIADRKAMFSSRIKQHEFKTRLSENVNKYIETTNKKMQNRKLDLYLDEQFRYKIGDKIYTDYKGIDSIEGNILKICRLYKVEEVQNEKLYSALIEKKKDEEENESIILQDMPKGLPVLFALQTNIEEITENKEIQTIHKLIQLLSDLPKENINYIQYIGKMDIEGNIYRNIENCSEELIKRIKIEQDNYKKQIKEKQLLER